MKNVFAICLAGAATMLCASSAFAAQVLEVQVDKSRMLTLPAQPGAIVVGNPSIADVTTNGDKLFVHGRTFGETNLMILDINGNTILEYNLVTRHVNETAVAVFKGSTFGGTTRQSFTCYPICEADIQVGDDPIYFGTTIAAASKKTELATGSDTAEAKAPPAPQ
jgi:Flp pilus assembly secretin CpaC